jgi:hypothetical protein
MSAWSRKAKGRRKHSQDNPAIVPETTQKKFILNSTEGSAVMGITEKPLPSCEDKNLYQNALH